MRPQFPNTSGRWHVAAPPLCPPICCSQLIPQATHGLVGSHYGSPSHLLADRSIIINSAFTREIYRNNRDEETYLKTNKLLAVHHHILSLFTWSITQKESQGLLTSLHFNLSCSILNPNSFSCPWRLKGKMENGFGSVAQTKGTRNGGDPWARLEGIRWRWCLLSRLSTGPMQLPSATAASGQWSGAAPEMKLCSLTVHIVSLSFGFFLIVYYAVSQMSNPNTCMLKLLSMI